jgi:hypothetical protein
MARSLPSLAVQPSRVPDEAADDSALADFLRHAVPYEFAGPIPASLLLFGVIGSALLLTTGLLALVLPSPSAIQASAFFWFEAHAAATVVSWMQAIALPAVGVGGAMLLVDVYLANGRRNQHWRPVVGVQSVVGNLSGVLSAVFLAFVVFIIVVYIVLGILFLAAICTVLVMMLRGAAGG